MEQKNEHLDTPVAPTSRPSRINWIVGSFLLLAIVILAFNIGNNVGYANGVEDSQPTDRELKFIEYGKNREELKQFGENWEKAQYTIDNKRIEFEAYKDIAEMEKDIAHEGAENIRNKIQNLEAELGFLVEPQEEE